MKKVICDGCSKEIIDGYSKLQIPCHIADEKSRGHGYIDREGNQSSGRMVDFDLCNKCSNKVYDAAYAMIKDIKSFYRD